MEYKINNNTTNDRNDWRFQGQDKYLMNVQLIHRMFNNSIRNHTHCEFCWDKFSERDGDIHEGYCTLDKYHWICEGCFNDFKELFKWQV